MSLRIIFAGTPEFSVPTLEALIGSEHEVVAVYTQPDRPRGRGKKMQFTPIKEVALKHDIPVYQPLSLRNSEAQEELALLNADLMIVVAYGLILPEAVLKAPKLGCLNIHASLLPRWRGAAPIHRAIEAGDDKTGVAIMQMDKGLDTGDVWSEASVAITPETTMIELHDTLKVLGAKLLLETIPTVVAGEKSPQKQLEEGITYAEKISKEEAKVNWEEDHETIMRKIHAFNPFPGAFTSIDGELLKLFRVAKTANKSQATAGTLRVEADKIYVVTGDGFELEILELQVAGKRKMESALFIKGHEINQKVCQ
ncbi:methionyl-tRNA formyltransferase [Ignatzschineria rhizosphaerae]|uniref:Methionyl-tRNA formyltransferase n=1 Tax=Ignatzschineria rhizosphaerae TaxID=2923279 RepID=A0ABY3X154_9GAMM|nr:methionyl-tRNA formyltransferase [Ignatzschineria rhizosphaerae]UNM96609.1 methionyl-tRNA formyltransferase [Ignatzschineria rhizosphaerae]